MIKLISFLAIFSIIQAFPRRHYTVVPGQIQTEKPTVETGGDEDSKPNALGTCTCDITRGSCDAYCCCDTDCGDDVRTAWQESGGGLGIVCAKNYIGQASAPEQRCLGRQYLAKLPNKQMGMAVTEEPGKTSGHTRVCVELDSASWFSVYIPALKGEDLTADQTPAAPFAMEDILYTRQSHNRKKGVKNAFNFADEMLSENGGSIRNFIMPQRDLFGFCDNFKSTTFLQNVNPDTEGTCVQQIRNLVASADTVLKPETYKQRYLKGSKPDSDEASQPVEAGKLYLLDDDGNLTDGDWATLPDPVADTTNC